MLAIVSITLLAGLTFFYVYFITKVRLGLLRLTVSPQPHSEPFVSIIVAARNEERSIDRCIRSLFDQTYRTRNFEIIVVNDGSSDRTCGIVRRLAAGRRRLHLLHLSSRIDNSVGRKPEAIALGISKAKGEIIMTTDADCIAPSDWVEGMIKYFGHDVALVAGPVLEAASNRLFQRMQSLEFLGLMTTAAGLIGAGSPIICNGANLAYRKSAFISVGGFGTDRSSNDDERLMNRILQHKAGRVVFAPEARLAVHTSSSPSFSEFLRQRIRWAAKRGHYEDRSVLVTLVALYAFFASFLFSLFLIPVEPLVALPVTIVFVGKLVVDYFALLSGARRLGSQVDPIPFLVAEVLHVPYIVVTAALGQFVALRWKGRSLVR